MTTVSVQDLDFSFIPSIAILSRLELELLGNESVLIVGDNGSGKSTFGRLLAGILRPTSGTIRIDGKPPEAYFPAERCRQVTYLGQVTQLSILTESVYRELASIGHIANANSEQDKYVSWAKKHALPLDLSVNPRDLALPDLWRFAVLLYAILLGPKLFVLDEVVGIGSKQQQDFLLDVLASRRQSGEMTIVLYQRRLPFQFDHVYRLQSARLESYSDA